MTLRQNILSCFSEIDCFLMPHPGKEAHADVFKGGDLPKSTCVLMATANATNMAAVDKARKRYMSGMTNRPRRNLNELREFHCELLAEANKVFDEFPKIGGEVVSSTSKDVLTKDLEELFQHFFKEEEEIIRKEQEEEAKTARERCEGILNREALGYAKRSIVPSAIPGPKLSGG
ncbi:atlastin-3-like [Rhipicephalus sanguineus]|uniref:atlastin-3-like n=1 Tax=Rhipicephalus sanguineus TaxID=34632 RepID=UPI0020C36E8F|nr:atlastin-3-like [Rhipicephalus sanguineus]